MEERLIMNIEAARPRFKRKKYLVRRRFQLKYVGLILTLMFLTAALCAYVVYYTSMLSMGEKLANVYPQGRLVSIVNIVNFRIILSLLLVTPLVALIGVFLSHRIAGPVFRMESFLKGMTSGDLTGRIVLRKGDELSSLADHINELNDSLNAGVKRQKEHAENAILELDNMKNIADEKPANLSKVEASIKKLDSEIRSLIQEMEKYKV